LLCTISSPQVSVWIALVGRLFIYLGLEIITEERRTSPKLFFTDLHFTYIHTTTEYFIMLMVQFSKLCLLRIIQ